MEEDEDVVWENSSLHRHLQDVGILDFETKPFPQSIPFKSPLCKGETIDGNIIEEVLTLKATNLLFEDDIGHVDCIFANFELDKNEPLRHMFRGTTSALVLALGICCYVYIGSYAFVLVSIFYAYKTSDYLWQKRRRLKQLERLMLVIQSNFSLLNRVIKFIYENENMLKTRFCGRQSQRASNFLSRLKADFIDLQREINQIFSNATCTLLKAVPLCEYVENSDCYVCKRMEEYSDCDNLSQLHNMYMLLQSQFLTRLIFSLVPNLIVRPEHSYTTLNQVITRVTVRFREIQSTLNSKFKYALLNGVYIDQEKPCRPLPKKERSKNFSTEMLIRNVHDLSNSLQFSFIKARELEASLDSNAVADPEDELAAIQSELNSCQCHISDILIMQKKYSPKKSGEDKKVVPDSEICDSQPVHVTTIGYSDLDPIVDDDIFEAVIDNSSDEGEKPEWETEEVDPLAKKKRKEMLGELKTRLKQQAEDWARRESMVLARKGMSAPEPSEDQNNGNLEVSNSEEGGRRKRRKYEYITHGDSSSEDDLRNSPIGRPSWKNPPDNVSFIAKAMQQTQGKFVPFIPDEESFCWSGESSDVES